jgi:hypothetical protein
MNIEPYRYSPLSALGRQIRLVTILPGSFEEEIHLRLHTTDFSPSNPPTYAALSYTWGSPDNPDHVRVNSADGFSGSLSVMQNLSIALEHL